MSSSALTKLSSRGQGMLATSPPDTTTSRTPGVARRYSIMAVSRSAGGRPNLCLVMLGVGLPTRSIRVQCPQYCGQVGSTSASTLVG